MEVAKGVSNHSLLNYITITPFCHKLDMRDKAAKILGKENIEDGFYGQEINVTTYNLCKINMFLHNIGYEKFNIKCDDILINPKHDIEENNYILSVSCYVEKES